MKLVIWCGDSLRRIRDFPEEARQKAGHQLNRVQHAKFAEAVYVLHAFGKKTRKTPKRDLELASDRFRAVIEERKRHQ
jgi:phage-related protein